MTTFCHTSQIRRAADYVLLIKQNLKTSKIQRERSSTAWCSYRVSAYFGQLVVIMLISNYMEQGPSWEANSRSASHVTQRFTVFRRACHWFVSWTRWIPMAVFWNVASCSLVDINRRFRGAYCIHHPRRQPSSFSSQWEPQISDRLIQSTTSHSVCLKSTLIVSSYLHQHLPRGTFLQVFRSKMSMHFVFLTCMLHISSSSSFFVWTS
jgi:hypothetical protein